MRCNTGDVGNNFDVINIGDTNSASDMNNTSEKRGADDRSNNSVMRNASVMSNARDVCKKQIESCERRLFLEIRRYHCLKHYIITQYSVVMQYTRDTGLPGMSP